MSGHSKWSTIKHKKGMLDQRRGALFTKLSREITVAAMSGDPDPNMNFRLRLAVDNAKSNNMPKDGIERAVARGSKTIGGENWQEITYEAYGPGGTGIIIQALTDNKNRAAASVRTKLTRGGGALTSSGSVSWNFTSKGRLTATFEGSRDPEGVALAAMDAGADDIEVNGSIVEVITAYADLGKVRDALNGLGGITIETAELTMEPNSLVAVDSTDAKRTLRLLDDLEELEDVQKVFANADFPEDVLEEYAK